VSGPAARSAAGLLRGARRVAAPLSPRGRRWKRFLAALPIDPARLERPLEPIGDRNFIMCGSPRTGTTLLCAALHQPPRVATVMEPWDGMRMTPAELFRSLRAEIDTTGKLTRGRMDIRALRETGSTSWIQEGADTVDLPMDAGYVLGVKWPAFWRYLDLLPDSRFVVCLRDPFEVVASCKQMGGRVAQGLEYDTAFNRELNRALTDATADDAVRRVLFYDYVHERLQPFIGQPNVFVVRYERWFDDAEGLLAELGAFLGVDVTTSPVTIRPPTSSSALTENERDLIRRVCRTAGPLGYGLGAGEVRAERGGSGG
jgi:hypothetical protein